jgi:hypothetical protein
MRDSRNLKSTFGHIDGRRESGYAVPVSRRILPLVAFALIAGCAGSTDESTDESSQAATSIPSLKDTVTSLYSTAGTLSPNTQVAIAVRNLKTDEYVETPNAGDRYISASSAKVIWVAAAMKKGANVDDIAGPIFINSDNNAASVAIQRAGGCDAVNDFMWNVVDMDSVFVDHSLGIPHLEASSHGALDGANYFNARASVVFLTKLDAGAILEGAKRDTILGYMKKAPDTGLGGWLAEYLPASVRPKVMHKGGWLPPGTSDRGTMNDIGLIDTPDGTRYAVAILARRKADATTGVPTGGDVDYWGKHEDFVKHASCMIYRSIAKDTTINCH